MQMSWRQDSGHKWSFTLPWERNGDNGSSRPVLAEPNTATEQAGSPFDNPESKPAPVVKRGFGSSRKYGQFVLGYPRPIISDFDPYLFVYAGNDLDVRAVAVVVFGGVLDSVQKHRIEEAIDGCVPIGSLEVNSSVRKRDLTSLTLCSSIVCIDQNSEPSRARLKSRIALRPFCPRANTRSRTTRDDT